MINYENIALDLNYMQRINLCLKKYYLESNKIEVDSSNYTKIINYGMLQTLKLFENFSFEGILTEEEIDVFNKLNKYYTFVCDKCFLEYHYDLNNSIYHKKLDYVNAKIKHIKEELKLLCYKIESIAFDN
jgi:hypothetical protein